MKLSVINCQDDDQPFKYRFGYYSNDKIYQYDLIKSLNGLNLNYLNDYSSEYLFETLLPSSYNMVNVNYSQVNSSNFNNSDDNVDIYEENKIILIASVMDSLGGITNLTLPVNVK